ncbi:hypothetical protein K502DRAFT_354139 [Neoconidiobolus thromboides FSU 785]|nr:hypothetical protein K502DRAFT_354139 [Neoconidiobolus thromboides FSU 785]
MIINTPIALPPLNKHYANYYKSQKAVFLSTIFLKILTIGDVLMKVTLTNHFNYNGIDNNSIKKFINSNNKLFNNFINASDSILINEIAKLYI